MTGSLQTSARVSRLWPAVAGGVALVVAVLIGLLITLRGDESLSVDAEWMEEIVEHRNPLWEVPSRLMDFIGGGWFGVFVVPIAVIVLLVVARRRWAALYFTLAIVLSAGAVQLLKQLFGRARPEEILVAADFGSFPSGHVANAATLAVVFTLVFRRAWVVVAGVVWVVLMALSRTYLGAHWVTDTVGGLLVGSAVALVVWAPFALRLHEEDRQRAATAHLSPS